MSSFEFNDDFESEENEFESGNQWSGKNATIYLIDTSPNMFCKLRHGEEDSSFFKSIRCVHSTVSQKIIGNDQDLYSIILFNTEVIKNALDFPGIYVLQDIDRPGAERLLELENILGQNMGQQVIEKYGSTKSANLSDVFWVCRSIIRSKKNLATKNILLFTSEDDPHLESDHKRKQAMKGARDLKEEGIDIEILPLESAFDTSKFYKDLLIEGDDEESIGCLSALADPAKGFDELLERVQRLDHKHRSSGNIIFSIGPGVEIGAKVFTFIRKMYKSKVKLCKRTNEEVVSLKKEYLEENGELLMSSDFLKYQQISGKKVKFSLEEVKSITKIYEPGIKLLGFKPMSTLKPFLYIKPANFIYPNESLVKGSQKLFSSLLKNCLKREVCPLVRIVARQGSSLSWGFLMPQKEVKDEGGCQEVPPGFHICYLPFADDFRSIHLEDQVRAPSNQVDAAKDVMKKLHFRFHPECFENPDIQTHWRNIKTLAMNRHFLEDVKDYTVPDYNGIDRKAGYLIKQFKSLVLSAKYDPDQAAAKKRPAPNSSSNNMKKLKVNKDEPMNIEELAKRNQVNKLKVDVMKEWLHARGVKVTGKKKVQLEQDIYDELHISY